MTFVCEITNSMEQSLWEANHSLSQEIYHLLWDLNVHYSAQKSPAVVPILSQMNQSMPFHPIYPRYLNLHSCLLSSLYPSGFLTRILRVYAFQSSVGACTFRTIISHHQPHYDVLSLTNSTALNCKACPHVKIIIPISTVKCTVVYRFSATLAPSDLLYSH
jgi:hypothetical protein